MDDPFVVEQGISLRTVGLGSTESYLPLLEAVDIPTVVPTESRINPVLADKDWQRAERIGATGWINAIAKIIQDTLY